MSSLPLYSTIQERIQAVLTKDKNASSAFVVAVSPHTSSPVMTCDSSDSVKGLTKSHCRPDCITIPKNVAPHELVFFNTSEEALTHNFKPCLQCHPDLPIQINPLLIKDTVNAVNASLNIDIRAAPLADRVEENAYNPAQSSNQHIYSMSSHQPSHNRAGSCAISSNPGSPLANSLYASNPGHHRAPSMVSSPEADEKEFWTSRPRRASIANGHIHTVAVAVNEYSQMEGNKSPIFKMVPLNQPQSPGSNPYLYPHTSPSTDANQRAPVYPPYSAKRKDERQSRGEGEHARLVSEACMHIAAAAAAAATQAVTAQANECSTEGGKRRGTSVPRSASIDPSRRGLKPQHKKRRGGILGFKELAAKAGLSPWHFHRVFRSVTGLTPKAYGDACWNTVTSLPAEDLLHSQVSQKVSQSIKTRSPVPPSVHASSLSQIRNAYSGSRDDRSPVASTPSTNTSISTPGPVTTPASDPPSAHRRVSVSAHPSSHYGVQKSYTPHKPVHQAHQYSSLPVSGAAGFEGLNALTEVSPSMNAYHEISTIAENVPEYTHINETMSSLEPPMFMMNLNNTSFMPSLSAPAPESLMLANDAMASPFAPAGFVPAHLNAAANATSPINHDQLPASVLATSMAPVSSSNAATSAGIDSVMAELTPNAFSGGSNALQNTAVFSGMDMNFDVPLFEDSNTCQFDDAVLGDSKLNMFDASSDLLLMSSIMGDNLDMSSFFDSSSSNASANTSVTTPPSAFSSSAVSSSTSSPAYTIAPAAMHKPATNTLDIHPSIGQFLSLSTNGTNTPITTEDSFVDIYS